MVFDSYMPIWCGFLLFNRSILLAIANIRYKMLQFTSGEWCYNFLRLSVYLSVRWPDSESSCDKEFLKAAPSLYELQMLVWTLKKALDYHELVLGAVACKTPIEQKLSAPPWTHVTWFQFFALFSSLFLVLCCTCKLAATTCQGLPDATLSPGRRAHSFIGFRGRSLKSELAIWTCPVWIRTVSDACVAVLL